MARQIAVWLYGKPVGTLTKEEHGFSFCYLAEYRGRAISLSMPLRSEPYLNEELHPFFKGLAPEGWLRKRYAEIQKIDDKDLFGLLMQNGNDLLGAVVLKEIAE